MEGQMELRQSGMSLTEVTKKNEDSGKKQEFTTKEAVLSVICFVIAFGFTHFVAGYVGGLWGGIFWLLTGVLGAVYVRMKKWHF